MNIKKFLLSSVAVISATVAMAQTSIKADDVVAEGSTATVEINLESSDDVIGISLNKPTFTADVLIGDDYTTFDASGAVSKYTAGAVTTGCYTGYNKAGDVFSVLNLSKEVIENGVVATTTINLPDGFQDGTLVVTGKAFDADGNKYSVSVTVNVKPLPTAISKVNAETTVKGGYTVSGAKAQDGQKGVRIVNGKKVAVK